MTENKDERVAVLIAMHVKKLEILQEFEITDDISKRYEKVKEALLDAITEMIQKL